MAVVEPQTIFLETPFDVALENYDELAWQPVGLAYEYEIYKNGILWKTVPQAKNLFPYSNELPAYPTTGGKTGFEIDNIPDFTVNSHEKYSVGLFFKDFGTPVLDAFNLTLRRYTNKNSYDFYVQIPNYPTPSASNRSCNLTKLAVLDYFLNNKYVTNQKFFYEGNLKYNGFSVYYQTAYNPSLLGNAKPLELFFAPRMRVTLNEPGVYTIRAITSEDDTNRLVSGYSSSVTFEGGMSVLFYNSNAEKERVDKTEYLTDWGRYGVTLKDACSITSPVLIMQFDKFPDFNYCYIPRFNRYYYITDITSLKNNIWQIDLKVDVLMSYKDKLLGQSGLVSRNEFEYDDLINDDKIFSTCEYDVTALEYGQFRTRRYSNSYYYKQVIDGEVDFSYLYSNGLAKEHIWEFNRAGYILNTITTFRVDSVYERSVLTNLQSSNMTHMAQTWFFSDRESYQEYLQKFLYELSNSDFDSPIVGKFADMSEFLSSSFCTTLDLSSAWADLANYTVNENGDIITNDFDCDILLKRENKVVIGLGIETTMGANYSWIVNSTTHVRMFSEFPPEYLFDKNYKTYFLSTFYLYLPFIGVQELPKEIISSSKYKYIVYDVDVVTGEFIAWLSEIEPYTSTNYNIGSATWKGNMYNELSIGRTNAGEVGANRFMGGIEGLIGTFIGGITQNFTQMFGGISSLAQGMYAPIRMSNANVAGSPVSFRCGLVPVIYKFTPKVYEPEGYSHLYGKPLNDTKVLREVHGFTVVGDIHLEVLNALDDEVQELLDILKEGIILP